MNDEQPAVDPQQNLERPARKQVPGPVTAERSNEQCGEVNIWSGRRSHGSRHTTSSKTERSRQRSKYRCNPKTDTGKTKGSEGSVNTFCLFFAKGMCYQGPDCTFLHRLPTSSDNAAMARSTSMDIFGREKLPDGLDKRRGAGSYDRDMTTLYVHYGGAGHYAIPQLRHLLLENFGEFGPVRGIHIVPAKTIAFVKYHWRASAEFAREALDQQSLTGSSLHEVLSVQWANDDPNPVAVIGRKRSALDAAETAAMAYWESLPPEEKCARIAMAQQARAQHVSQVAAAFPEALMGAAESQGQAVDDSFEAWRGFEGHMQGAAAAGGGGADLQQQQQLDDAGGSSTEGDPQAYAAEWQAYYDHYANFQQQQPSVAAVGASTETGNADPGAWYKGWRQRHRPEVAVPLPEHHDTQAARAAAEGNETATGVKVSTEVETAPTGGLGGLLAGYGSDSDAEGSEHDDHPDATTLPKQSEQGATAAAQTQGHGKQEPQQQQQQQPPQQQEQEQGAVGVSSSPRRSL